MQFKENNKLGIVYETSSCKLNRDIFFHSSFGRVVDYLAKKYDKIYLCGPINKNKKEEWIDYKIKSPNIDVIEQPYYNTMQAAIFHFTGIIKSYAKLCRKVSQLFIRGNPPYVSFVYFFALIFGCKICHWIVGNPEALLKSHRRAGKIKDQLSFIYAWQQRVVTRAGRKFTNGSFVCNGKELSTVYCSPRTYTVVSSTITQNEIVERSDTCQGPVIRILFAGFVRPEKGIEYLIEAVSHLKIKQDWELVICGSFMQFGDYKNTLDKLANHLGIQTKIIWMGHVTYGPEMFHLFRQCDIFVLPTLSEGTPHVLSEARANGLPIIATNVGGIPTSVTQGLDGILVPPRDAIAITKALHEVITQPELRIKLVRNGFLTVRCQTIDYFLDICHKIMAA